MPLPSDEPAAAAAESLHSTAELTGQRSLKRLASEEDVIKLLGRLGPVTYEHRQMIREGDTLALLEMFVSKQQSGDWIFIAASVGFGAHFAVGLLFGQLHWLSATIAMAVGLLLASQRKTANSVTTQVRQFVHDTGETPVTQESLLTFELRTRHEVDYRQRQRLKRGEAIEVAREVVVALKASATVNLVILPLMALPQVLLDPAFVSGQEFSILRLVPSLIQVLLFVAFAIYRWRSVRTSIERLEELLREHPPETAAENAGAEIESEADSPYRTPRFR